MGETGVPEVGTVVLRYGGSIAECFRAQWWKDRGHQRGLREGGSFEDIVELMSLSGEKVDG
jgi:hypothetical protein